MSRRAGRTGRRLVVPWMIGGVLAPTAVGSGGIAACAAPAATTVAALEQDAEAPVAVQIGVLMKVLAYDRNLRARAANELVLAVLFQSRNRTSVATRDEAVAALRRPAVAPLMDVPVRVISIDLDTATDLTTELSSARVTAVYVAPLRAVSPRTVTAATRAAHTTSLTGVPSYVQQGVAIGVGVRGDRPVILVNLGAARAEGADLAAPVLQLAQVIR